MPNRILKESIRTSKKVNGLTDFQFRVWAYLITYVDDYGRGSAEPDILKGFVFPRRKGVTEANIRDALSEMACMGLIQLYEVDGDSYLCFPNWPKHQTVRAAKSKFPAPDSACEQMQANEINRMQTQANAPVFDNRESLFDNRESLSGNDARADADPLVMYAVNNLQSMSPGNLHDLAGYAEDLPADVIRFAIDEGCANGAPRWSYVAAILRGYLRDGIRTVGDAKAAKAKHRTKLDRSPQDNPALNFEQREYKDEDFGDDFFIDLDKYGEGTT